MDSNIIWSSLFSILLLYVLLEQITYWKKKASLPGPLFVFPFLGNIVSLVKHPQKFWDTHALAVKSSSHGLSADYIIGRFMVFVQDAELCRKIFLNVGPDSFELTLHAFGKKIFGEDNILYMSGQPHKDIRRRMIPNFSPRALSTYLPLQQKIINQHLQKWEKLSSQNPSVPLELLSHCRAFNLNTSETVFVGPYLDEKAHEIFTRDYNIFSAGFLSMPIDLPGFGFREAKLAVERSVKTLTACVKECKAKLLSGKEPSCMIDFWMQETLKEKESGQQPSTHTSDVDFGTFLFDFLYAAQDTTTAALLWAILLLEQHPDVVSKVREEVGRIWSPESDKYITAEQLREMVYTRAVANEVLRYRPPAALVPHIAKKAFPLTKSYTVPKGTIVFLSVMEASLQGFTDPEKFDPERFSEERREDQIHKRNLLGFGIGAHHCVGEGYAINNLVLFIAMFTSMLNFKRHKSEGCDDIIYNPTTSPKDNCLGYISRRCTRYPSF